MMSYALPLLLAAATIADVVAELSELLEQNYVFPDKAAACAAELDRRLADGAFDDLHDMKSLCLALTDAIQAPTDDLHLRVYPRSMGKVDATPESLAAEARLSNFGFEQVLRLPENVALIDLRGFADAEHGRDVAVGAMNFVANADALVFDLRQNGGGTPEMVQLIQSYLFDEPTHLNSLHFREGGETNVEEFWTLEDVPGPSLADVPVVVLVSGRTFSAAEEFTYNLKARGRATIVGETTGGGAHPGDRFPLGDDLEVFISTGRAVNPITGTNWEGTGVEPDVAVEASRAFDEGVALATRLAREHRERREPRLRGDG